MEDCHECLPWNLGNVEKIPQLVREDHWRTISNVADVVWVCAGNLNIWIEHAACHGQVCSLPAELRLVSTLHQSRKNIA